MSDVLTWTVRALVGTIKVPDIKGLPTVAYSKK
jgi:hypothetical protein